MYSFDGLIAPELVEHGKHTKICRQIGHFLLTKPRLCQNINNSQLSGIEKKNLKKPPNIKLFERKLKKNTAMAIRNMYIIFSRE
jgi:hypothetical protein